jgi:hypothetical protein
VRYACASIDSRVFVVTAQTIATEPAGELTLKGFRRPIQAYNVNNFDAKQLIQVTSQQEDRGP